MSPPLNRETFKPEMIEGFDFLYVKLHGLPGQSFWYGDNWVTAMDADQLRAADLKGTGVFVANCYLFESVGGRAIPGKMLGALLDAGARFVVGGPGQNWALKSRVFGADLLGMIFRIGLQRGWGAPTALGAAKHRMSTGKQNHYIRDTLEFKLFEKKKAR